jgi:hypothetical protein
MYFLLVLLFIVKLIALPIGFPDAAVLLVLLAYRPVSQLLKLQEKQKISNENAVKFAEVENSLENMQKTIESIKIKEAIVNQFGGKR